MIDYLKLNLENKDAIIRLKDEIEHGDTLIVQAHFNEAGAMLEWIRNDRKPKSHGIDAESMDILAEAWLDFRGRLLQHEAEKKQRKEAAIKQAQELASSVHFDLESLNVQLSHDKSDNSWLIHIPAIDYRIWTFSGVIEQLPARVQEGLDKIKEEVEDAERRKHLHPDWQKIVDSYRRMFPLEQCQLCHKSFDQRDLRKLGTGCEMLIVCDPCGQEELKRRESEWPKQGEPAIEDPTIDEQAVKLLDASPDYQSWELDKFDAGYALHANGRLVFERIPAEHLLDHVRQYVNMRTLQLAHD